MPSDLIGLAAYTQWQTREIDYRKYKFWVQSSRMTDISQIVELPKYWDDEDLKNYFEDWVREVFPMFDFTDAYVTYGWDDNV